MIKKTILLPGIVVLISSMFFFAFSQVNLTGEWSTSWGPMNLTQTGDAVTGTYGGSSPGKLEGTVRGYKLFYKWMGNDGSWGRGSFNINTNATILEGRWGNKESDTNGGTWTANRLK